MNARVQKVGAPEGERAERFERERIELLVRRDGEAAARQWVARTLGVYRDAVASPSSHASTPQYRPHFEASIRVFEELVRAAA